MAEAVGPRVLPAGGYLAAADEAKLVSACVEGAPEAFSELLARYRRPALTLAYHMLGDAEEAEDVAQEAFVRVFQSIARFRKEAAFSTWLYRIVTNLCLGRKRRQRPVVCLDAVREPSGGGVPSEQVTHGMVARQVLSRLPAELRAVLLLREQEQLSYRDIAEALDVPLGTVRSRLSKARMSFRELWVGLVEGKEGQP